MMSRKCQNGKREIRLIKPANVMKPAKFVLSCKCTPVSDNLGRYAYLASCINPGFVNKEKRETAATHTNILYIHTYLYCFSKGKEAEYIRLATCYIKLHILPN